MIKESIWTSPKLNKLSDLAERHFYRILPLPDDFGCCELTALVVKGRCYPLKDEVSEKDIESWHQELEANGMIIRWDLDGRQYGAFITFSIHQRIRSLHNRKTPPPPPEIQERLDRAVADDEANNGTCRQLPSSEDNPNVLPHVSLKGGAYTLNTDGFSKANKRLFLAKIKELGLEERFEEELKKLEVKDETT